MPLSKGGNCMANPASTRNRLHFAEKRLNDFKRLNNGNIQGANGGERQQLIQEFFFHLVGSIDFLLQVVNQERMLGLTEAQVKIGSICHALPVADPIRPILQQLHPNHSGVRIRSPIYSDTNNHLRIMILRHRVCHRGDNPFRLSWGSTRPRCSLLIDPRHSNAQHSKKHVFTELELFLDLVRDKVEQVMLILGV